MPVNFINNGTASIAAAEKIKVILQEKMMAENPWIVHRAKPIASESLSTGGGIYRFLLPQGYDLATRRSAKPQNNTVTYEDGMTVNEVTLTVQQPWQTPIYAFEKADRIQLDGVDFSPISQRKVNNVLIKTRIKQTTEVVLAAETEMRNEDISSETSTLAKLLKLRDLVANYDDISVANGWTEKASGHFDGQNGTLDEVFVHLHPAAISEFSAVNTEAGAGSTLQFLQFQDGTLTHVLGKEVIKNKYISKDKCYIASTDQLGMPDEEVMKTDIIVGDDKWNQLTGIKGMEYFDVIMVAPELWTVVTLNTDVVVPSAAKKAKKAAAEANAAAEKAAAEISLAAAKAAEAKAKAAAKLAKEKEKLVAKIEKTADDDEALAGLKTQLSELEAKLEELK